MSNTYPITPEQEAVLRSFTCERLTADNANLYRIQYFTSRRGPGLVDNLKRTGWSTDSKGSVAYYVIKNPDGQIVLFFSLKCGVLFDPNYVVDFMENYQDTEVQKAWHAYLRGDNSAFRYFDTIRRRIGEQRFQSLLTDLQKFDWIKKDKRSEPNQKIIRVVEGHSAIELVEFCANDRTKGCWKKYGMAPNRMGEVLFWWFIVPKMLEISSLIGCEYAFLFAADETPDGFLVRYYEDAFHFRKMTNLGTVKPFYDMNCYFMGKRLRTMADEMVDDADLSEDDDIYGLDHYRDVFFENFNLSMDAPDMV